MRKTLCSFALLVAVVLLMFPAASSMADSGCYTNPGTRVNYDPVYGAYCGYTGSGCTDCWYTGPDGWGTCATDGIRCEPRIHPLGP